MEGVHIFSLKSTLLIISLISYKTQMRHLL